MATRSISRTAEAIVGCGSRGAEVGSRNAEEGKRESEVGVGVQARSDSSKRR